MMNGIGIYTRSVHVIHILRCSIRTLPRRLRTQVYPFIQNDPRRLLQTLNVSN